MDKKIQDAIREAVRDAGQDEGLARKLESWFEAIASGSEDIHDKQSSYRHLELLYDDTHASGIRKSPAFSLDDLLDDDTNGGEQS
jgi:uncharacterized protein (DUF2336 family)